MIPTLNDIRYGIYGILIGVVGGVAALTSVDSISTGLFPKPEVITITRIVEKKVEVKAAKKTTIVKKKTKPNGVTETATITIDEKKDTTEVSNTTSTTGGGYNPAKYSIGVQVVYRSDLFTTFSYKDIRLTGGVRLGNLPLWLEGGYRFNNAFSLGARYEF